MRRATAILLVWLAAVAVFGETGKPRTDLNLRAAPTSRSKVIAVLGPGDEFEILETRRGWCRVRVASTRVEGWVSRKYVELVPDRPQAIPADAGAGAAEVAGTATFLIVALITALLAAVGYAAGQQPLAGGKRSAIPVFISSLVIGTFYVGLTLPKGLMTLGTEREWMSVARLGEWSLAFNHRLSGVLPDFPTLISYVFWAVVLYLSSLLLLAVRHGQMHLFGWGIGTLTISVAILHLIIWGGYIVAKVAMFVFWLFRTIGGFLMWVVGAIFVFLAELVSSIFMAIYRWLDQLLGDFWWLVPLGLVIVLVAAFLRSRHSPSEILKTLAGVLLIVSAGGLVVLVLRWIWQFIAPWVIAALKFLSALLLRLLAGVAIVLAVATIGQLLLDQIHGALSAGRRRRGVIIGAIAIGTSIAILLFVSNVYGIGTWLPASASEFAGRYLHQPAPLLDVLIALGIVALSIVGVWRNVPALGKEPTMQEFGKSLVYSIAGVFFAGALVAIAGETEE
jgi:hypothetical protein